ncbi:MAG TPA: hypothetical protein VGC81_09310 [Candidatus Methylomirabilis sp.]
MKKVALPLLVAFVLGLSTLPAAWAQQQQQQPPQAAKLYQQCQEQLKKDPANEEAKKLCDEGMKLLREGKQEEAVKMIQAGLEKFKS